MNGAVCVDASVAAKWVLPEDDQELANRLLRDARDSATLLIGPPHLAVEVASAVYKRLHSGELTVEETMRLIGEFQQIPIVLASPPGLSALAIELSSSFGWSLPYDGFYLALGEIVDCDVWTADRVFFRDAHETYARLHHLSEYPAA